MRLAVRLLRRWRKQIVERQKRVKDKERACSDCYRHRYERDGASDGISALGAYLPIAHLYRFFRFVDGCLISGRTIWRVSPDYWSLGSEEASRSPQSYLAK